MAVIIILDPNVLGIPKLHNEYVMVVLGWVQNWSTKIYIYSGHAQKNGAVSKVIKQFISHPTRAQHTLSAADRKSVV
jgi:hypothetical protein